MKTHWKKLVNKDYIGSHDLMQDNDKSIDLDVTIKSVAREMVMGADGKKEECTVAKLEGQKPIILNTTNMKTIAKVLGSAFVEDWVGKKVTLFVERVKAFGEWVDALRVRPTKPALPLLDENHKQWAVILKRISAGEATLETIETHFSLTASAKKTLKDAIPTV